MTQRHKYYELMGYTAATHHYLNAEATRHYTNINKAKRLYITVANRGVITPSLQAKVPLTKELSNKAQHVFILDKLNKSPAYTSASYAMIIVLQYFDVCWYLTSYAVAWSC